MNNVTTRKLLSGLVLLAVGVAVTLLKGDIPEHLSNLMESLYFAFVAGNMGVHAVDAYVSVKGKSDDN